MILGIFVLLTALMISVISAYYSIIGLTAIFAASFWPVVIMGASLELGKLASVVWLHKNWRRAGWQYRSYLIPAVVALMLITSMGTFGYLSRAHIEQGTSTGDVSAKVAIIDEKIKVQRDNID